MHDLNPDALREAIAAEDEYWATAPVPEWQAPHPDRRREAMAAAISAYLAAMAEQGWELRRRGLPEFPDVEKPSRDVRDILAELPIRAIREPGHE